MRLLNRVLAALWLAVAGVGPLSATHVAASQFMPAHEAAAGFGSSLIEQAAFTGPRRALLAGQKNTGPTWLGNFLNGSLPSGVSVSSPSLGGLVTDSTGKLTYKPNNLLTYSNTFSNAAWTLGGASLPVTNAPDPFGGNTASFLQEDTSTNNEHRVYPSVTAPGAGGREIYTVYAKANGRNWLALRVSLNGTWTAGWFNLASGTVGTYTGLDSATISSAGNGWYKLAVSFTGRTDVRTQIEMSTGDTVYVYNGDGVSGVYLYGASLARVTYETTPRAADQVISGAQAYYGPAWDYDPVNVGTPLGLRIWESRTNYAPYSNFQGGWTTSGLTITAGNALGLDGTNSAAKLQAGGATALAYQAASLVSGTTYAYSADVKAGTSNYAYLDAYDGTKDFGVMYNVATGAVVGNRTNGTVGTPTATGVIPLGNGWYRCWMTFTSGVTSGSYTFQIGVSDTGNLNFSTAASGNIYAQNYNAQIGSSVGPPIPTSSQAVTAAADVVTLTGTALSILQGAAFSAVPEYQIPQVQTASNQLISTAPVAQGSFTSLQPSRINWYGGGVNLGTYDLSVRRSALAWKSGSWSAVYNGGTVSTGTGDFTNSGVTTAYLGFFNGTYIDGYIRKLALYSTKLPDFALQQRTVANASFAVNDNDNIPDWLRHSFAANDNRRFRVAMGD